MHADIIRRVIRAYDDPIVRAYCWIRFWILRQRFLDEIGQYLPPSGPVLDIVHHIAPETVPPLLRRLHACLAPGGVLVLKDVDTRPAPKRWFTWALDKLMAPTAPVRYWSGDELAAALRGAGFEVRRHAMLDFLPYPHVIYIATRRP